MSIPTFYYLTKSNSWSQIPEWAEFMIKLGLHFARYRRRGRKLNLILTVPTRGYAASFLAVGVMAGIYRTPLDESIVRKHFENITSSEIGSPLIYYDIDRALKAVYDGVQDIDGEKRIRIQTSNERGGNLTYILTPAQSLRVREADQETVQLPAIQIGRVFSLVTPFFKAVLKDIDTQHHVYSSLDILLVGSKKIFEDECVNTLFAVKKETEFIQGNLNEIIKIKTFGGSMDIYRSEIISSRVKGPLDTAVNPNFSPVIIFDGASGFLNFRDYFTICPWIVVLDRTDPSYEDSLSMLYNRYVNRPPDPLYCFDSLPLPRGIEMLTWEEKI